MNLHKDKGLPTDINGRCLWKPYAAVEVTGSCGSVIVSRVNSRSIVPNLT